MRAQNITISCTGAAALLFWTATAAVEAFVLGSGTFIGRMFTAVTLQDLAWRLPALGCILAMGGIIGRSIARRDGMAAELARTKAALDDQRARLDQTVAERTGELNALTEQLRKEISYRARTEDALSRSERFLSSVFDSFHDPLLIVDTAFRFVKFNDAYLRMRGIAADELRGRTCYQALHGSAAVCDGCLIDKTIRSKDPCAKEKQLTLPDGSVAWFEIYTYPLFDGQRNVTHVVEFSRDITDRKKGEDEKKELIKTLNHLSTTDTLTGMLNRRALNERLQHEIDRAVRYSSDLSLILCDVDRFKKINDTHGHTAGDRALAAISETIQQSLRKSDILGRYGGDEFLIILPETGRKGARSLGEKLRAAVERLEFRTPEGKRVKLSLSVGVASCCSPTEDIDTLVALADTALYASKESGRNKVSVLTR